MTALLILNYDVLDHERFESYLQVASAVLADVPLITSTSESHHLSETTKTGARTVVLKFDSVQHALDVYHSPAYQSLLGERLASTVPRFAAVVPVTGSSSSLGTP